MKAYKVDVSNGCLCFLCAYACFDPGGSFLPFLISVSTHELGHFLALWLMDIPVYALRFGLMGAQIHTAEMNYKQELIVASSGPGVNLFLFLFAGSRFPMLAFVNLILLVYNLLPFYPLDGGRILRCLLRSILPLGIADYVEKLCVLCCGVFLLLAACYLTFSLESGMWPLLLCLFLFLRIWEIFWPVSEKELKYHRGCGKIFPL